MRLLLKNAELFDGESDEGRKAHVLIDGERVEAVLTSRPEGYEGDELDLAGACLAPGFIDTHTHNDLYAVRPDNDRYMRSFVRQGITTMVGGNCGFSTLGIDPATPYGGDLYAFFKYNPNYAEVTSFEGWAKAIDDHSPVNMACLCGHGTMRTALRGLGDKPLTAEELDRMERDLDTQLAAGAAGLSFGLMYNPSMYGEAAELERLARVVARHGKVLTYHTRANSKVSMAYPELLGRPHNLRAMDEVLDIAKKTGVRSHISHMIYVGRKTWKTLDKTIDLVDNANNKLGLDISFDIYPFDCGVSTINVILPVWYQSLSMADRKKRSVRMRLAAEILATKQLLGFGYEDIQITWAGPDHQEYIGRRVSDISADAGEKPLDTYLRLIDEGGHDATVMMFTYMNEHIINKLSRHPAAHYMTDAWIVEDGVQNPAAFHTFPRLLRLSREGKAEKLGRMIRKMTGRAAERFGLADRGKVKPGYYADLVVFDRQKVSEGEGEAAPIGLPHVIINGEFAVQNGEFKNKNLGRGIAVK